MTEYEKLCGILLEIDKEGFYKHEGWEQRVEILELMLPDWMSHRKQTNTPPTQRETMDEKV